MEYFKDLITESIDLLYEIYPLLRYERTIYIMEYETELLIEIGDKINVLYAKYPSFCASEDSMAIEVERAKIQLEALYDDLCELFEGIPNAE
jgi:hypothetical protein